MTSKADSKSFLIPAFKMTQPIGEFYIGCMNCSQLVDVTYVDVRRIHGERGFETYLGIQRPLDEKRVEKISQYVRTVDACFPTAVILAVPGVCASYDEDTRLLTLSEYLDPEEGEEPVPLNAIAKVLDGQHRIDGLKGYQGSEFDVNVCIFIDMDIAEQAYIFSTVNLTQTKVNRSLAYDLFDLAKVPSPQKLCHNIAVALDRDEKSPFYEKIKRLGVATPGRFNETITQATFVQALMRYVSKTEMQDRNTYMLGKVPKKAEAVELQTLIFRNMMIDGRDTDIGRVVFNYFDAVRKRWPTAWSATGRGIVLNKTNGFKGLMRFLRDAYLHLSGPGGVPSRKDFEKIFAGINLRDEDFTTERFPPGTSGEVELYRRFLELSGVEEK